MRLLHIQAVAQLAGCERSCETFIASSKSIEHVVAVLGDYGPAVAKWEAAGARVIILGVGKSRLRQYRTLRKFVGDVKPSGVILWTNSRLGLLVSACRLRGRTVAVHVGNPITMSWHNRVAATAYQRLPSAGRAMLVPVSEYVKHSVRQWKVFDRFPTRVILNGTCLDRFAYRNSAPETLKVGMAARLDPIKDHATLLRAWALVAEEIPEAILELAGDGVLRAPLEKLAQDLGLGDRVAFRGWITDVPKILAEWTIVIHSTTEQEGLGNSMVEAMAMGLPLVATDVGPVREVTDHGRAASLVPVRDHGALANTIVRLIRNPDAASAMGMTARSWVRKQFNPNRMVVDYLNAIGSAE